MELKGTIAGIYPIYPQHPVNHSDGIYAASLTPGIKKEPDGYVRTIRRRVHVPWLAKNHESTFLNNTTRFNKDKLPDFKPTATTGQDFASTEFVKGSDLDEVKIEGFGKAHNLKILFLFVVLYFILYLFISGK